MHPTLCPLPPTTTLDRRNWYQCPISIAGRYLELERTLGHPQQRTTGRQHRASYLMHSMPIRIEALHEDKLGFRIVHTILGNREHEGVVIDDSLYALQKQDELVLEMRNVKVVELVLRNNENILRQCSEQHNARVKFFCLQVTVIGLEKKLEEECQINMSYSSKPRQGLKVLPHTCRVWKS